MKSSELIEKVNKQIYPKKLSPSLLSYFTKGRKTKYPVYTEDKELIEVSWAIKPKLKENVHYTRKGKPYSYWESAVTVIVNYYKSLKEKSGRIK